MNSRIAVVLQKFMVFLRFLCHPLMYILWPESYDKEFSLFRYKINYYLQLTTVWIIISSLACSFAFLILPIYSFDNLFYIDVVFDVFYYFYKYYSFHFDCFAFCLALEVFGFGYVATVTCRRSIPFANHSGKMWPFFIKFIPMSIFIYFIGPCFVLWSTDGPGGTHNKIVALSYNYLFYFIPFYIGIHNTYMDYIGFLQDTGDRLVKPVLWKTLKWKQILFIIGVAVPISVNVVFTLVCLCYETYIVIYLVLYIVFFLLHALFTILLYKWYDLHVHHYMLALLWIPAVRCNNPITAATQGLLLGVCVEGSARWHIAPLYDRKGKGSGHLEDRRILVDDVRVEIRLET